VQREIGGPDYSLPEKTVSAGRCDRVTTRISQKASEKEVFSPRRYGGDTCWEIWYPCDQYFGIARENPAWKARIAERLPVIQAEIVYCIRNEMAETIEDLLARRTGAQMYGWKDAIEGAPVWLRCLRARKHGFDT